MTPAKGPNKRAKGDGSVYELKDGRWAATLELPPTPTRPRNRVTRSGKWTEKQAEEQLKLLRRERDLNGTINTSSQTLATWLNHWLDNLAEHKPKTAETNRSLVKLHIIPAIGRHRLDKLTTTHVRSLKTVILAKGLSPSTALRAHSVLDTAMDAAFRDGLVPANIVKRVQRPRKAANPVAIVTPEQALKVMWTVSRDRLGSRIAAAFYTGARQGELLGLELDRVNLNNNTLDVSWQLQALSWQHGCNPICGRQRGTDCPKRRLKAPADWEHRHLTGTLYLSRPKSKAGKRVIPLVEPLRTILQRRITVAQTEPNPHGLVWTADPKSDRHGRPQPLDGSPIYPGSDSTMWHDALTRAGVPAAPLHAARHTTASLLLRANVPETIIIKILGHNNYVTSVGYMDIDENQTREAMTAISALMPYTDNG